MRAFTSVVIAIGLLSSGAAQAFTIANGGTRGCHEEITALAFQDYLLFLPFPGFTPPEDGVWRAVADFTLQYFDVDAAALTDTQKFVLVSLIVGVRSPDTDGHSSTNLESVRQLHGDPGDEGQYLHALRGIHDDGEDGDVRALDGMRESIREAFGAAFGVGALTSESVFVKAPFYLDFYGRFEITVLGPAFHLGRAAHVLQDSFSHAIRTEDSALREVAVVFNYIDAIATGFRRKRDGLPHSVSLDDCSQSTALFNAATLATIDLFLAAREVSLGRDPGAIEHVLDGWLNHAPDCGAENGYCGSAHWAELADEEVTEPYFEAIFDCSSAPADSPTGLGWALLAGLAVMGRRRSAQRRRSTRQRRSTRLRGHEALSGSRREDRSRSSGPIRHP